MKKVLLTTALITASGMASAAPDVAAVVTEIGTYPAMVGLIGGAALLVVLAVKGFKWAQRAL